MLKWVFERTEGKGEAVESPIGYIPTTNALDLEGLDITEAQLEELLTVDADAWKAECGSIGEHFARFGDRLPPALAEELDKLCQRLRK